MFGRAIAQFAHDSDARVVEHEVKAVVFAEHCLHRGIESVELRHVHGDRFPRWSLLGFDVRRNDRRAPGGQLVAERAANAGCAAGDDGNLALESAHACDSSRDLALGAISKNTEIYICAIDRLGWPSKVRSEVIMRCLRVMRSSRGFTLIELLVVIGIIAALAG